MSGGQSSTAPQPPPSQPFGLGLMPSAPASSSGMPPPSRDLPPYRPSSNTYGRDARPFSRNEGGKDRNGIGRGREEDDEGKKKKDAYSYAEARKRLRQGFQTPLGEVCSPLIRSYVLLQTYMDEIACSLLRRMGDEMDQGVSMPEVVL